MFAADLIIFAFNEANFQVLTHDAAAHVDLYFDESIVGLGT